MATFHEHLKRRLRAKRKSAKETAPYASESVQREIDRKRAAYHNIAVSDALTGTDRADHNKRVVGHPFVESGKSMKIDADMTAAYNDSGSMICPKTGASLSAASAFTRPMVRRVDAETWADIRRLAKLLKAAGRNHGYAVSSMHGGLALLAISNPGRGVMRKVEYIIGRSSDGNYVARKLLANGKTAIVVRGKAEI